jgi:carbohydrate-selective porin OprB
LPRFGKPPAICECARAFKKNSRGKKEHTKMDRKLLLAKWGASFGRIARLQRIVLIAAALLTPFVPAICQDESPNDFPSDAGIFQNSTQPPDAAQPAAAQGDSSTSPVPLLRFWNQQYLTGDWGGARSKLDEKYGFTFNGFWQNGFYADPSTGQTHIASGIGDWSRIRATLDIDMYKLAHVRGLSLHITSVWNVGSDVGADIGSLVNAAGNDTGLHQFRLDSWWARQELLNNKLVFYVGQVSGADFFGYLPQDVTHFGTLGPYYAPFALYNSFESFDPLTTPAAMVEVNPTKHLRFRSMIQSITEGDPGDPAVSGFYNWIENPSGTSTQIRDGAVWNNEIAYLYGSGEAHFGVSYSGARAYTQWTGSAANGTLVTTPGFQSNSIGGDENYYWILKQYVYRPSGSSNRGVDLGGTYVYGAADKGFLPYNRQLVLTAEANGLIPKRSKDSINFAFDYLGVRGPLETPVFTSEKVYELNYVFQVNRWFAWQPDLQFHQGIGANPLNGTGIIVGFRSTINF